MANIVPSELHPDEAVRYSLASAEAFELAPGGSYETTDREVLRSAEVHPWLSVELDEEEAPSPTWRPESIEPSEDALSAENSVAFDPEAVKRDQPKFEDDDRTAIESGKDQGEFAETAGVATTLAADDTDEGDESF